MTATALVEEFFIPCGQNSWEAPIPHLAAGDFDGDGLEDVAVSLQHFTVRPVFFDMTSEYWSHEGTVIVFRGTEDGGFEFDQYFQRDTLSTDVVAMDVDEDGLSELVIIDGAGALETWSLSEGLWVMTGLLTHDEALFGLDIATTVRATCCSPARPRAARCLASERPPRDTSSTSRRPSSRAWSCPSP